jgi:hypothetical protein
MELVSKIILLPVQILNTKIFVMSIAIGIKGTNKSVNLSPLVLVPLKHFLFLYAVYKKTADLS